MDLREKIAKRIKLELVRQNKLGKDCNWLLGYEESETERRILNLAQNEREKMLIKTLLSAVREIQE